MSPKREKSMESRIFNAYEAISKSAKRIVKKESKGQEKPAEEPPRSQLDLKVLQEQIDEVNRTYDGLPIDDMEILNHIEGYSIILGIESTAIHLGDPNVFCGEQQLTPETLKKKVEEGLYYRDMSFSKERYFTIILSDATVTDEVMIMTRAADVGKRRKK